MARLLLFDVDLTLVKTLGAGRAALDEAFTALHGVEHPSLGIRLDGRTDYAIFTELIERHGRANGDLDAAFAELVAGYLARLPAMLEAKQGEVLPGVVALLDALGQSHAAVGLATGNVPGGAELKLRHYRLWERFATGGFGNAERVRAEVVKAAVRNLANVIGEDPDPTGAIVIGDTPLDAEAAHAAGARALCVATGSFSVEDLQASGAEFVFADLSHTAEVLAALRS